MPAPDSCFWTPRLSLWILPESTKSEEHRSAGARGVRTGLLERKPTGLRDNRPTWDLLSDSLTDGGGGVPWHQPISPDLCPRALSPANRRAYKAHCSACSGSPLLGVFSVAGILQRVQTALWTHINGKIVENQPIEFQPVDLNFCTDA